MSRREKGEIVPTVRDLFEQVQDLPEEKRVGVLDATCGTDTELRRQVDALLRASEEADSRFNRLEREVIRPNLESVKADPDSMREWIDEQFAPESDLAEELVGQTVSHYEIQDVIGRGGMGVVYRAHDLSLDRTVALKFLPAYLNADKSAKTRLLQEARTASGLDHPNIATIFEVGETQAGRVFIAMGYYPGKTLQAEIQKGPIALDNVIDYSIQLASALTAAHGQGIVHRDLKPANVLITREETLRLVDFGLAKVFDTSLYTQTGVLAGTAAYMSPEQISGTAIDDRTDIWSLGVMIFEMLSGKRLFDGDSLHSVLHQIFEAERKLSNIEKQLPQGIPKHVIRILRACLVKDPDERYQSASDLLEDLKQVKAGLAPNRQPKPKRAWKSSSLALVGIVPVLIAAAALILVIRGGPPAVVVSQEPVDSIAVLPFVNLSEGSRQNYFVDGIHDGTITSLAKISSLRITSRPTTLRYRDSGLPLKEIANELGVKGIVLGSVQLSADRIRVTAQLVDPLTDSYLWADSYEGRLSSANIFGIQGEITTAIAGAVKAALSPGEKEQIGKLLTGNLAALEAYYSGRIGRLSYSKAGRLQAVDAFTRAISLDPGFAHAYSELALTYISQYLEDGEPATHFVKAEPLVEKALQINDELTGAHIAQGHLLASHYGDMEGALESWKFAVDLDPNNGEAWVAMAFGLSLGIPFNEVYPLLEQVVREKPGIFSKLDLAYILRRAGNTHEALEIFREELERNPNNVRACWELADYYNAKRDCVEAMVWFRRAHAIEPDNPVYCYSISSLYYRLGDKQEGRRWAERSVEIAPDSWMSYHLRIKIALDDGALDQAMDIFQTIPDWPMLLKHSTNPLLRGLVDGERYSAALAIIEKHYPEFLNYRNSRSNELPLHGSRMVPYAFQTARALMGVGESEQAEELFDRILQAAGNKANRILLYNAVSVHAIRGEREMVMDGIEQGFEVGLNWPGLYEQEVFRTFFKDQEFQALVEKGTEPVRKQLSRIREMEKRGEIAPMTSQLPEVQIPAE